MVIRYLAVALTLLGLVACGTPSPSVAPAPTAEAPLVFDTILPRGAVVALENPTTVPVEEAERYLGAGDLVLGVEVGGEARAYPIGLMSRHEIANDVLGGEPIAVTFCPLCNSGVAFSRTVAEGLETPTTLTFEVSGKLIDNALIMVDKETESLWAQSRAGALQGPLEGVKLQLLATSQSTWQEWVAMHPETTLVVDESAPEPLAGAALPTLPSPDSADTSVAASPGGYVIGFSSGVQALAYPLEEVEARRVVNGELDGLPPFVLVALGEPGAVAAWERVHDGKTLTFEWQDGALLDRETGSRWNPSSGIAEEGLLAGAQLQPASTRLTHWLGWRDLYPSSTIWQPS